MPLLRRPAGLVRGSAAFFTQWRLLFHPQAGGCLSDSSTPEREGRREEEGKLGASLGYRVKPCLKTTQAAYGWCIFFFKTRGVEDSKSQGAWGRCDANKELGGGVSYLNLFQNFMVPVPKARIL